MEIKEKREKLVVVSILCDICGNNCEKGDCGAEYATLEAHWGFDSNKDLEHHKCHFCEDCYDKVRKFIESDLKGKVDVREYRPTFGSKMYDE